MRTALFGAVAAAIPVAAGAQDLPAWLDLRGLATVETAVETGDGDLQKTELRVEPEATVDLGAVGRLRGLARLRVDPADEIEPGRPRGQDATRSAINRRLFIGDVADVELRELFLDTEIGPAFARIGKQQIVWGEADGLRVLDVVNPFSFREFILPEFEDYRIPLTALNLEVPVGQVTAQFVWVPDHTYDEPAEAGGAFAVTSPRLVPAPPPSLVGAGPVTVAEAERPDDFLADDDFGLRLNSFVGGWDLSLVYLYHHRDEAIFFRSPSPGGGITFTPRYERTHLVGGTFSNAFGDLTLRGEAGVSTDRFFITNDAADADGVFETAEIAYVLGLDYQYDADAFLSAQVFQSMIENPPPGAVRDRLDTSLTLLAEREFLNDKLTVGGLLIQSVNDGDGLLQLDASYQLRSNVVAFAGVDVFYGDDDGLFGQFEDASRVSVGVEIGF